MMACYIEIVGIEVIYTTLSTIKQHENEETLEKCFIIIWECVEFSIEIVDNRTSELI